VTERRTLRDARPAELRTSWALGLLVVVAVVANACNFVTSVAVQGADFGGASANAYCDRRYVSDGGTPSAFCQEIVGTLAASQFADDCRNNHQATTGPGLCPRPGIVAGCKLNENNSDGSQVWDWYYDVSSFPDAGPDGAPYFAQPVATSVASVALVCADRSRYPQGAELTSP
jgi:hypothetical protein